MNQASWARLRSLALRVAFGTLLLYAGLLVVTWVTTPNVGPAAGSGDVSHGAAFPRTIFRVCCRCSSYNARRQARRRQAEPRPPAAAGAATRNGESRPLRTASHHGSLC